MSAPAFRVCATRAALAEEAEERVFRAATSSLLAYGRFDLALSGGSTPRRLYERLARQPRERFEGWHFWWGDERFVPEDHADSNTRMAREAFLGPLEIPPERVHAVPVDSVDPQQAAQRYEEELSDALGAGGFGLVLLGMGADGHTASLFPNTSALEEDERLVTSCRPPAAPHPRITLTFPALAAADQLLFLVAGADKAETIETLAQRPEVFPAGRARSERGTTTWLVDADAAARLQP